MVQQHEPHWADVFDEDVRTLRATLDSELHCTVSATRTLQSSLRAPAEARTFVAEEVCLRHDPLATAAAALVASELVTYAALSGEGPITIALECGVTTLTLSVTCSMRGQPETTELRLADPVASMIVDSVCRSSGTLPTEDGLTMWGTIPTGYIPVVAPRAWTSSLSDSKVSARPRTIPVLNARDPRYGI